MTEKKFDIFDALAATAHAMGQRSTPEGIALMAEDLAAYSEEQVAGALRAVRRKNVRFCVASILDEIHAQDGRPSADRAWAMMPKSESESGVVTTEMIAAWTVASEQYDDGDVVGAQIAFKREYLSLVEQARADSKQPNWIPSLGHDRDGRVAALVDGITDKRISFDRAKRLVSPVEELPMLVDAALSCGAIGHDKAAALTHETARPLRIGTERKCDMAKAGDALSAIKRQLRMART